MKHLRTTRSQQHKLYMLIFLNGFLVCLFMIVKIENDYENRIFSSLASTISDHTRTLPEDSIILSALHTTHALVGNRSEMFRQDLHAGMAQPFLSASLLGDLMTAEGACGSYSKVMVHLVQDLGFKCRIAQMKVKGKYGGHIIPEIYTSSGWVIVDPMFDLSFTHPDGRLASFEEVSKNWDYYKSKVPADYDHQYSYEGVRYTNWNKIPVVMPFIKKCLDVSIGKSKADQISIRPILLSMYRIYSLILLLFIMPLSLFLITKIFNVSLYSIVVSPFAKLPLLLKIFRPTEATASSSQFNSVSEPARPLPNCPE